MRVIVGGDAARQSVAIEGVMRELDVGSWFNPLVEDVHKEAVAQKMTEVVLDIRRLECANASVWRCLVLWMRKIRRDPAARYYLHVLSEPKYRWQTIGISALRAFGAERLMVD